MTPFYASIKDENGYEVCGFDCEISTSVDWSSGEPVIEVTEIIADVAKFSGTFTRRRVDIMADAVPLVQAIASEVRKQALSDPYFRQEALESHGVTWRGGMSPSARYVEVR